MIFQVMDKGIAITQSFEFYHKTDSFQFLINEILSSFVLSFFRFTEPGIVYHLIIF